MNMHIEILVEDASGKKALEILVPKITAHRHSFRIHSYKGVGRIPANMKDADDPAKRILLTNLPKLLKGYGRTPFGGGVVLVCDLDNRSLTQFLEELKGVLD